MKLRINVDGQTFEVEVEVLDEEGSQPGQSRPAVSAVAATPAIAPQVSKTPLPSAATSTSTDEDKVFRSPISGVVVRQSIKVGQTVEVNDELIVLEAMKMETALASKFAGKISKIHTNVGDSVQAKQILIELE